VDTTSKGREKDTQRERDRERERTRENERERKAEKEKGREWERQREKESKTMAERYRRQKGRGRGTQTERYRERQRERQNQPTNHCPTTDEATLRTARSNSCSAGVPYHERGGCAPHVVLLVMYRRIAVIMMACTLMGGHADIIYPVVESACIGR
jgi:hypothetical protein